MTQNPSRDDGKPPQPPPQFCQPLGITAAQKMNAAASLKTGHHGVVGEYGPVILLMKNDETVAPFRPGLGQLHDNGQIGVEIRKPRREEK